MSETTNIPLGTNTSISTKKTVEEYINKEDWRIKANANSTFSNASMVNNIAGKVVANYWLDNIYSDDESRLHREGYIHIHDLDCLTGYCAGWSLRVLLNEGFNGVEGKVSSSPPKHFREALGQMVNFLGILQSEWAGAQAFSSFDTYLSPYVFKDNLTKEEIKKALRQFVYNLNVPSRWGQSPFTNITLDITVPEDLKNNIPTSADIHLLKNIDDPTLLQKAQQRGVHTLEELTYQHFEKEMKQICIAYYEIMTEGDALHQPFTFPIPTVNITKEFNWDDPVAHAIIDNARKVGSSYFQNFLGSQVIINDEGEEVPNPEAYSPSAIRSMCCRLQLDLRELMKRGNGLFGSAEMTGSIGVVTINMARLGYIYRGDKEQLFSRLKELMGYCKSILEKKRAFINQQFDKGLYPYTKRYLRNFNNHFSTIGVNGINELILNFTNNQVDISSPEGISMAEEILDMMRAELKLLQEQTNNLYNLEATPAEGATYRFAKEDYKRYPDISQAGSYPDIYYTNSSQLPVAFSQDPFEVLTLQDSLQTKYTGGTVQHIYLNEVLPSIESTKSFLKKVLTKFKLPYVTLTPVFSICQIHGYIEGEQKECPTCGEKTMVWTRVMGYHRPVDSFNIGKRAEHEERKYFKVR